MPLGLWRLGLQRRLVSEGRGANKTGQSRKGLRFLVNASQPRLPFPWGSNHSSIPSSENNAQINKCIVECFPEVDDRHFIHRASVLQHITTYWSLIQKKITQILQLDFTVLHCHTGASLGSNALNQTFGYFLSKLVISGIIMLETLVNNAPLTLPVGYVVPREIQLLKVLYYHYSNVQTVTSQCQVRKLMWPTLTWQR